MMSSGEMWELSDVRRYTLPNNHHPSQQMLSSSASNSQQQHRNTSNSGQQHPQFPPRNMNTEDLHEWSIYRQNLNSDFTDSALGSDERSPLPYGNFQLREQTIQSILSHPRLGPSGSKSELSSNMYSYLKFGLPRVFPQQPPPTSSSSIHGHGQHGQHGQHGHGTSSYGGTNRGGNKSPLSLRTITTTAHGYESNNEDEQQQQHHRHGGGGGGGGGHQRDRSSNNSKHHQQQQQQQHNNHNSRSIRSGKDNNNLIRVVSKSETDLREGMINNRFKKSNGDGGGGGGGGGPGSGYTSSHHRVIRSANSEIITTNGHGGGGSSHVDFQQNHHTNHGSQISLVSRNSRHPTPNTSKQITGGPTLFYSPMNDGTVSGQLLETVYKYPHFQVRGLCYESRISSVMSRKDGRAINSSSKSRILEGISFDLRGGELMAVMTTTSIEGTILLDVLCGRRNVGHIGDYISGEFLLNGNPVTIERLGNRVSYVRKDYRLHPDINVVQTVKFYSLFKKPILKRTTESGESIKTNNDERINLLLEELGLTAVRHSLVETLTCSERQRLTVACQLCLDTDIVFLDQPTKGMDIFDTFFLVDYLRGWSGVNGRIIIMTIHPPTFEIFSMFTKVGLISTGRLMFYGYRREMLPYFAFIEYPCPGFKNPSDYYIDLVTLDDLSNEALLESSQRIETLADSYRRKQESFITETGQSTHLPMKIYTCGPFEQIFNIWIYMLSYSFPWNLVRWLMLMILSAGLSILIGTIYWNVRLNVPQEQNSANDRFGLHWTLMVITPWPILLILSCQDLMKIQYMTRDVEERLYTRATYIIAKILIEIPFLLSIFLAYTIPAYVMAGLPQESSEMDNFYSFIGYMMLYLYSLRCFLITMIHTFNLTTCMTLSGFIYLTLALTSGYSLHFHDIGNWVKWIRYISPTYWILQPIIKNEFKNITIFTCPTNPIILQGGGGVQNIMTKLDCGLKNGSNALIHWEMNDSWPTWFPLLTTIGFIFIFLTTLVMIFILKKNSPSIPQTEKP